MATEQQVRAAKRRHGAALLKQPGISGVGIEKDDRGEYVLTVHVDNDEAMNGVPNEIDGLPVRCIRSGPYRAST